MNGPSNLAVVGAALAIVALPFALYGLADTMPNPPSWRTVVTVYLLTIAFIVCVVVIDRANA